MGADVIDDDTERAVVLLWQRSTALSALTALPPGAGRLPDEQPGHPRETPYAVVTSALDKSESTGTGGTWHDWRKVTLTVYGKRADVVAVMAAAAGVYNHKTALPYPSGARFMRWWPVPGGGNRLEEDPERKAGEDVWRGVVEATAWSIRTYGT